MKFIAIFVAIIVALIGFSSATICAKDLRSGGPQNFANYGAMRAENNRGGRKYYKSQTSIFYFCNIYFIS